MTSLDIEDFSQASIEECVTTFDNSPNVLDDTQKAMFITFVRVFPNSDDIELFLDLLSGLNKELKGEAADIILSAQKTFTYINANENQFSSREEVLSKMKTLNLEDKGGVAISPRTPLRGAWRLGVLGEIA